ncbi:hypothetical protein TNIN_295861 [Trichonephila inaurata madagascariensis]|uniref:Uncharacterized protein n=1 Tax=Trichonephila inaurata madagascariensis TaxID=2747483 RepID=A0A8X6Y4Y6_9ARAC|nr:hypothetical protein TNIN_295861 [Trichonephila inaurata madagascariensis]
MQEKHLFSLRESNNLYERRDLSVLVDEISLTLSIPKLLRGKTARHTQDWLTSVKIMFSIADPKIYRGVKFDPRMFVVSGITTCVIFCLIIHLRDSASKNVKLAFQNSPTESTSPSSFERH